VDIGDNEERCTADVALTGNTVCRRLDDSEPLPWDALLSISTLKGECQIAAVNTKLDWELHSMNLIICLSQDKYELYCLAITKMMYSGYAPIQALKTNTEHLEHASAIIHHMHHFLGCIQKLNDQACDQDKPGTTISRTLLADLTLAQQICTRQGMAYPSVC
jgi:hypothetical protein